MSLSKDQWLERRDALAETFTECLGGFPQRVDLEPEIVREAATGEFVAQWVRFQSEPGERVPGLFVKPVDAQGPLPVIVALPGGHRTKDLTVFGHEEWPLPFEIEAPGHRFPVEKLGNYEPLPYTLLLDHGFALMSIDWRVFGARAGDRPDSAADRAAFVRASHEEYGWLMRRALVDGRSAAGLEIWDVIRTLDYLSTRDDVDSERIGCMGFSMGGGMSWQTAIIEPRVGAVCTVSCLVTYDAALKHRRDSGWHTWIPNIRKYTSRQELFSIMAPRPLLIYEGDADMPGEGRDQMIEAVRARYGLLGAHAALEVNVYEGGHGACLRDPATFHRIGVWFREKLGL